MANSTEKGPFWIHAIPENGCGNIWSNATVSGILYYGKNDGVIPLNRENLTKQTCDDEKMTDLVPFISKNVPSFPSDLALGQSNVTCYPSDTNCSSVLYYYLISINPLSDQNNYITWNMNKDPMHVDWSTPTLLDLYDNKTEFFTGAKGKNLQWVQSQTQWVYLLMDNSAGKAAADHPMHLHGHDFYILAQGSGIWDQKMKLENPPRRDTVALAAVNGYILIAWEAKNPGAWLFHCHLGWHTEMGFDIQFLEKSDVILSKNNTGLYENCRSYMATIPPTLGWQHSDDAGV